MNMASSLSRVAACFAFLSARYLGPKTEVFVKDGALKQDLEEALNGIARDNQKALSMLAGGSAKAFAKYPLPLGIKMFALAPWFEGAQACLKAVAASVRDRLEVFVAGCASEVQKLTPKYDHIVTKDKVNVAMVRKFLLNSPTRQQLVDKAVALHKLITLSVRFRTQWSLPETAAAEHVAGGGAKEEGEVSELDCHIATLKAAKAAVTVTGACSIAYELKGKEQKIEKDKFLAKDRPELAASLMAALKSIA
jgi:hypothetical protein